MIHIATVHWLDDTWVDIQLRYFEKYLQSGSYRVYAFLNGIDPERFREKVDYIRTDPIRAHVTKLNILGDVICENALPEDLIFFIDGDAFPVGNIENYVRYKLRSHKIVAIQRLENDGDPQPHPSFCATTVGFWQDIQGDWGQGPKWRTNSGLYRTDTGGKLWKKTQDLDISWAPMLRSNALNLHPLWFGVYEDLIYHHGAAFRTPYCVIDILEAKKTLWKRLMMKIADSTFGMYKGAWLQNAIYSFVMKQQIATVQKDSQEILDAMQADFNFARRFSNHTQEEKQPSP